MALEKSNAILEQHADIKDRLIEGLIEDADVKALLAPKLFDDPKYWTFDVMRDFVQTIGKLLTDETFHGLTARLITLAPEVSKNSFMRNETLEKYFLAYEMAHRPELAEKHFYSDRMKAEIPLAEGIVGLKKLLQPSIDFFQAPQTPEPKKHSRSPRLKQLIKLCDEYQRHLKKSIGEFDNKKAKTQDAHLCLAHKKYEIVQSMLDKLKDDTTQSAERIKNMKTLLSPENKQCLQEHRSSLGARFLEALLYLVTAGFYSSKNSFAFWKSHGEVLCDTIEAQNNFKPS